VNALERFSAEIRQGEIVAIIAAPAAENPPAARRGRPRSRTSGAIVLDNIAITAPHQKIGIIFQERGCSLAQRRRNIGFGLSDAPAELRREKVARALQRVGLRRQGRCVAARIVRRQAQRSRSRGRLVPQPEVLLLTRPFSALDAFTRRDLQTICSTCGPIRGPTLVLVTHDVSEAWCWPIASS